MTRERWATFSVKDHIDTAALIPEILLYDRLVIPTPPGRDEQEIQNWKKAGWAPELLHERLTKLDDIAIRVPWNEQRQELFKSRFHQKMVNEHYLNRFHYTRLLLRDETLEEIRRLQENLEKDPLKDYDILGVPKEPSGGYDVVTAYRSKIDFDLDFSINPNIENIDELSILMVNEFAVPKDIQNYQKEDQEKILNNIITMVREDKYDFKKHRQKFYEWEEDIFRKGVSIEGAKDEMRNHLKNLNECIENTFTKRISKDNYQYAFTLGGIALAGGKTIESLFSGGSTDLYSVGVSLVPVAKEITTEIRNQYRLYKHRPALMLHDAKEVASQFMTQKNIFKSN